MFARWGIAAEVFPVHHGDVAASVRDAIRSRPDALIAAGGDGTINAIASALRDNDVPLGILPVGTLNHFAKDLGVPSRLPDAIAANATALIENRFALLDVGAVNGRVFVNNSSIGFYPRVIRRRDRLRSRLVLSKWLAMFYAVLQSIRRYPEFDVTLDLESHGEPLETVDRRTPFVFVGNNRYALHLFALGGRKRLDRGELCVYVAHRPGRFGTIKLLILALFRRLKQAQDFNAYVLPRVVVNTPKRRIAVAIDGEVHYLHPPLRYEIRPRCLKILAP
jgi:diacylglycerol kinase family enzyme